MHSIQLCMFTERKCPMPNTWARSSITCLLSASAPTAHFVRSSMACLPSASLPAARAKTNRL
eukprot:7901272-Pyramimonas_sp.AAC.1